MYRSHTERLASRRELILAASMGLGTTLAVAAAAPAAGFGLSEQKTPSPAMKPAEVLALLKRGNLDFLAGKRDATPGKDRRRRLEIARAQYPIAVLVSCSDSRVPPELLFGRGLGELFIVRNAGNTIDTVAMGSLEYAVAELGIPLVVVLGHERCGAVAAALAVVEKGVAYHGSIGRMIEPIIPAVLDARRQGAADLLDASIRANVSRTVLHLREFSEPLILTRIAAGTLRIVGARYDLDEGSVDFFDEVAL